MDKRDILTTISEFHNQTKDKYGIKKIGIFGSYARNTILREVIINALVHSDYSQHGAPIRVVFLNDRTVTARRVSHQIATLIPLFQTAGEAI
jgi:predicted HTH transcriptional regulator